MNQDSPLPNQDDYAQTGRVHPLIEVPALDRLLRRQAPVVLLDARWHLAGPPGIESYRKGHLPGAVFVDLDRDVAGPPGRGGRHPLPEPADFEAAMRRAGVSRDSLVVVYDDADSTAAARVWWSLRYFGHDRVRVLDGGYRAWTEAGHRLSTDEPEVKPGDFIANPGRLPVLDAEGAAELAKAGVLLDARAAERYRGEQEPVDPVAGHIPGARNAPTSGNVGVDGRFLPPGLLRERFAQLGATDALDVGAYCGSGVTAAHEILALNLAGIPAALYVGSWSDWVSDPSNPVATGDA
ncbi:thiosulfate/3-mercaptopyruvate sulfurtransferase [Actinomadura meyerae]|jgi:thiosulfate/3-mercaptopyruvate sulfurtransferase|uniref:Thiosulfate/3-mercaptopyruvate sulfurtransferase n=1 Tax=Actinomadura meyerae TaxID=240840 RepID=A0A239KL48_9ACTN|nr:thiosulfate/3-mercaptopyruvate sulfurtransferase [Actinomadura meyerae]